MIKLAYRGILRLIVVSKCPLISIFHRLYGQLHGVSHMPCCLKVNMWCSAYTSVEITSCEDALQICYIAQSFSSTVLYTLFNNCHMPLACFAIGENARRQYLAVNNGLDYATFSL